MMTEGVGSTKGPLRSYPKVWNIGHPYVRELFEGEVYVQEKVDGSQFSFGVLDGVLYCRSKGRQIHLPTDDKLFFQATETAQALARAGKLEEGWIYRGEVLHQPKHNALEYGRIPVGCIMLFDIDTGLEDRMLPADLAFQASNLGLESVPLLHFGEILAADELAELLETESVLGNTKVEGVVVKNYDRWGRDGKQLMGKFVSEKFREAHTKAWGESNKSQKAIVQAVAEGLRTEARWEKAVQHLREAGKLQTAPQDIGPLIIEVQRDIVEEEEERIKDVLWRSFKKDILRGSTRGLPEWYKRKLLVGAFENETDIQDQSEVPPNSSGA
jgi:hypothetical protein